MHIGVIGSGSIGPDLAYAFLSASASQPDAKVFLVDIKPEALGLTSQPLQYVDRKLFHGRRRAYTDAVTFVRMDRDELTSDTNNGLPVTRSRVTVALMTCPSRTTFVSKTRLRLGTFVSSTVNTAWLG